MITELLILLLLIILNAFFAASEMALVSLNDNKIKVMAESGHKKAVQVSKLLGEPSRFLATIQIGITLAGFLASAFAADSFAYRIVDFAKAAQWPISEAVLKPIAMVSVTLILSYFTLVLGELVPKRLAMKKAESIAFFVVIPLTILSKIASPFVWLLTASANFFVRLFGVDPNADDEHITEEEIRMMVDVGEEKGAIDESEKLMINNIFEFDDKIVSEIMTHRTDIVALPIESTLYDISRFIHQERYTRFPVYEEHIDNIIGIAHVKDFIQFIEQDNQEQFDLQSIIRAPYFVPESKKINQLFKDLQQSKNHMAIAIDEYGGTAGIVTFEDIIEEIVGNISDEYDEEEKIFEKLDEHTYLINGMATLEEVNEYLDLELYDEECETLSGFLISKIGRIPAEGEQPVLELHDNLIFKVEKVAEKRIEKVKVYKG